MALGLIVLVLGVYGSELFLSRISLVILLTGLVLCLRRHQLLRELRFPLLVSGDGYPIAVHHLQPDHLSIADFRFEGRKQPAATLQRAVCARNVIEFR